MTGTPPDDAVTALSAFLAAHNYGDDDSAAGRALAEVTEAVLIHDKTGTVDLRIKVERLGSGAVTVTVTNKAKAPETPRAATWYLGLHGELTKADPAALFHEGHTNTQETDHGN